MEPEKSEILKQEYQQISNSLDSFGQELSKQIQQIFDENNVSLGFPIRHRTKSWESIQEKLKSLTIRTILEMQDLCGLRFVLLFKRDISRVINLLSAHFKVQKIYDTHERLASDQFGYSSIHILIEMPENWFDIPTLKNFKGFKAEVQIRTLAQHTWAAASHVLQYKTEENVPKSILRSIYRVSAILEIVDIEFERFLKEREEYIKQLNSLSNDEIADSKLNVNSLEKILDENLPAKNKTSKEDYSDLLQELKFFDINNSTELITLIKKHKSKVLERDIEYGKTEQGQDHYFNHTGLLRSCFQLENPQKWKLQLKKWEDD